MQVVASRQGPQGRASTPVNKNLDDKKTTFPTLAENQLPIMQL